MRRAAVLALIPSTVNDGDDQSKTPTTVFRFPLGSSGSMHGEGVGHGLIQDVLLPSALGTEHVFACP
jgi:hypothetical protein